MRVTVDANVLVYVLDPRDPARQRSAIAILSELGHADSILTVQSLAEFFHVCIRKRIASRADTLAQLADLMVLFREPAAATLASFEQATRAWLAGRFGFWDAMLLAAAGAAGCEAIISEDMADGATLDRVRVVAAFDAQGGVSPAARAVLGLG